VGGELIGEDVGCGGRMRAEEGGGGRGFGGQQGRSTEGSEDDLMHPRLAEAGGYRGSGDNG
jgi:hypothetical protein